MIHRQDSTKVQLEKSKDEKLILEIEVTRGIKQGWMVSTVLFEPITYKITEKIE